ncbi:MAG: hypothetical protein LUH05_06970, partial [Candidatus Gastranaerophilales bacterium]|nr:hypothetical protein [Candidatus Gastranaerophilales bacterium]
MNLLQEKTQNNLNKKIFTCTLASDLPEDWDNNIENNPYLKKDFLTFIEQTDNSQKKYCIFRNSQNKTDTQFLICRTENNNLGMFTPFKFSATINSIYFPFSISSPAGVFGEETKKDVNKFLKTFKGFTMIVNIENKDYKLSDFTQAVIPPKCLFEIKWHSFSEYMKDLRAGYRRRYNIALNKSKDLKIRFLKDNKTEFTEQMYNLYLDIYNNASCKLGKVPIDYFKQERCIIFVLEDSEDIQGFAQLYKNGEELIFEYVGFNKKNVLQYDTYIKILLEIIRFGIENGYKIIDMGQTTDETKLKLGCRYKFLYALIRHSNPIINFILQKITTHIQYKPLDESRFHVYK